MGGRLMGVEGRGMMRFLGSPPLQTHQTPTREWKGPIATAAGEGAAPNWREPEGE